MPTTVDRQLRGIALILATAFTSVLVTLIVELMMGSGRPEVALTASLHGGSVAAASTRFDERVRQRFPLGSPESVVTTDFAREGFRQIDFGGVTGTEHEADRNSPHFPCLDTAVIYWRAGASRRVTSIRGAYFQTCP